MTVSAASKMVRGIHFRCAIMGSLNKLEQVGQTIDVMEHDTNEEKRFETSRVAAYVYYLTSDAN